MFKEMSYVYAVYLEKSFTKAAQKLYLSQPALSSMVKKAEKKIGMPIFDRSTTPITLTAAGRYYIAQAERIMQIQRETEAYFMMATSEEKNHLRLGGPGLYQAYVFPPIIASFREKNPHITVSWVEARNELLIQKLLNCEIDLFPEVDHLFSDQIDGCIWKEEHLLLAVSSDLPINEGLEKERLTAQDIHMGRHLLETTPAVNLRHFADQPFILMTEANDSFHRAISICKKAGFVPKQVSMAAAQMLTAYQLAGQGMGVTFVCDSLIAHSAINRNLYFYKLAEPEASRPMYIYHRRDKALSSVAQEFMDFILKNTSL